MTTQVANESQIQEFKANYNKLLQTFRDLKDQEVFDEPRLKTLHSELDTVQKQNLDSVIRIKLLQAQLSGASEDLLNHFMPEFKRKDEKIVELEQKLEDKELEAQRKATQHQNILSNLRTKYEEKVQQLQLKKEEYETLVESASSGKVEEESVEKINQLRRKKEQLEERVGSLNKQVLASESQEGVQTAPDASLIDEIAELERQTAQANNQVKELESYLQGAQDRRSRVVEEVKSVYQPQISQEIKNGLELQKGQNQRDLASKQEQQLLTRITQLKNNRTHLLTTLTQKQSLQAKLQAEQNKLNTLQNELKDNKLQEKTSQQDLEDESKRLKVEHEKLASSMAEIKKSNAVVLEDLQSINGQLEDLKKKQNVKVDKKELAKLREQKADLEKQIERERQKQTTLKELQKSYHPQSELRELKQRHESLRQQINTLALATKDSAKLTRQIKDLKQKIGNIKAKEDQMVNKLVKEQEEILTDIKNAENQNKSLTKDLDNQTLKLNAYSKAFPDHEQKKLEAKKIHRKQEQQKSKEKRLREKEEAQIKKNAPVTKQEEIEIDFGPRIAEAESGHKIPNSYLYGAGGLLFLLLWFILSRY